MDPLKKKYQPIDEQIVLFNDEYYLSVQRLDVSELDANARESLFNHLFAFDSSDIELEIDISEEQRGVWYLQLLVPHVLTLPDVARKRLERGAKQLASHLMQQPHRPASSGVGGDDLLWYVRRYNPDVEVIA
ncbi:MAG: hypothetical protein DF221_16625 [Brevibacillus sp.]|nr:MAG: hypothetical protein DF221_16625 [Brevibacillus sp.]